MSRVYVLGSLNVDLTTTVHRLPRPGETIVGGSTRRTAGGKGGNQAIAAAATGAEVVMVAAIGGDEAGAAYRDRLQDRMIDVSHVRVVEGEPTGHAFITVDLEGENVIVVSPGANAELLPHHMGVLDTMAAGDVLLVSLEVPIETVAAAVQRVSTRDIRVVVNAAPYHHLPVDVVEVADPLVVNEHEALELADDGAFPASLLVTFGAAGASWMGVEHPATPVPPEDVVDTTGAGDAFCGALAAHLALGATHEEAVAGALRAGADAVRHRGAQRDALL
ncbi:MULTISPECIES: ribokinase [Arsenicicoccus]|uniref:Ribokinase n=1 Tax=Arsenicicoccus bolidensis TaxID=229480 RepID=A0ABS9Q4Y8_9MICO|nr:MULTISPECIES: ribokinase [Arsenicicoccus]MCG7322922.1 ribokinase [Arsenicicoccus bolidensis]